MWNAALTAFRSDFQFQVMAEGKMLGFTLSSDSHKFLWLRMWTWAVNSVLLILSWNGNTQSCDGQSVRTICPEEGQVEALRHTCPRAVMSSVWIRGFWDAMVVWSESSDGVRWIFGCCRGSGTRSRRLHSVVEFTPLIKSFTYTAEEELLSKLRCVSVIYLFIKILWLILKWSSLTAHKESNNSTLTCSVQ